MNYALKWRDYEKLYQQNMYNGDYSGVRVKIGKNYPRVIISAVHATNHMRNNEVKYADRGTGGLSELLAEELGTSSVTASTGMMGDGNHDEFHGIKNIIMNLQPEIIIDLHGAKNFTDPETHLDIGEGVGLIPLQLVENLQQNLKVSFGKVGTGGSKLGTITCFGQTNNIPSIQLEIPARNRPPTGADEDLNYFAEKLIKSIKAIL